MKTERVLRVLFFGLVIFLGILVLIEGARIQVLEEKMEAVSESSLWASHHLKDLKERVLCLEEADLLQQAQESNSLVFLFDPTEPGVQRGPVLFPVGACYDQTIIPVPIGGGRICINEDARPQVVHLNFPIPLEHRKYLWGEVIASLD